jgi:hypothetical protein
VLDWLLPWKKLVISAEFNGILPGQDHLGIRGGHPDGSPAEEADASDFAIY